MRIREKNGWDGQECQGGRREPKAHANPTSDSLDSIIRILTTFSSTCLFWEGVSRVIPRIEPPKNAPKEEARPPQHPKHQWSKNGAEICPAKAAKRRFFPHLLPFFAFCRASGYFFEPHAIKRCRSGGDVMQANLSRVALFLFRLLRFPLCFRWRATANRQPATRPTPTSP